MKTKRPWTRAEKSLFFSPLLLGLVAGGVWWKSKVPLSISVDGVIEMAFSPDGQRLAVLTRHPRFVYSNAGTIFDSQTGTLQTRLQVPVSTTSFNGLAWSPDGSRLALGFTNFKKGLYTYNSEGKPYSNFITYVSLWNTSTGWREAFSPCAPPKEYAYASLDWSRDGKLWGVGASPSLFDSHDGQRLRRYGPLGAPFQNGIFNESHTLLAISQPEGDVLIYEIPSGRLLRTFATPESTRVVWSHDDDIMAFLWERKWKAGTLRQGKAVIVNARTGRTFPLPRVTYLNDIRFGRGGQVLLSDERSHVIRDQGEMRIDWERIVVWDYKNANTLWQTGIGQKEEDFCRTMSVSPDGRYFLGRRSHRPHVGTSWITEMVLWGVKTGEVVLSGQISGNEPYPMVWSPDSKRLVLYVDGRIQIHRIAD